MKIFFARQAHIAALPLALVAGSAQAQNSQTPAPAPTLIPGLEGFRLPGDRPSPAPRPQATPRAAPPPVTRTVPTPRPAATPTPRATRDVPPVARPIVAAPRATPTSAMSPQSIPTPIAPSTPPAIPAAAPPVATEPLPQAAPSPLESSTPAAATSDYAEPPRGNARWFILGGVALLLLAGLGWVARSYLHRRGRDAEAEARQIEMNAPVDDNAPAHAFPPAAMPEPRPKPAPEAPLAAPLPPAADVPQEAAPAPAFPEPAPAIGPRARIELALRPLRAGTNLTSAAVEYEIEIRNSGEAAARGIRLDIRLLSASADQDAILTALFAAPVDRPPVAPFDLEPGAAVSLGGMAMLPNDAISVLGVQGKAFYVPVMAVNALYHWAPGEAQGGSGQTAAAFVIGIDRGPDAKMAPFRLDTGPRMYEGVAQRPHDLTIER